MSNEVIEVRGRVTTPKIADRAITEEKIAVGAVTTAKIAERSVTSEKVARGAITHEELALDARSMEKISGGYAYYEIVPGSPGVPVWVQSRSTRFEEDLNYLGDLFQAGVRGIPTKDIRDLAVTTAKLADGAVTAAKLADLSVTTDRLANLSVTTTKLADRAVTTAKIDDFAVTREKIVEQAIDSSRLALDKESLYKVSGGYLDIVLASPGVYLETKRGGGLLLKDQPTLTFLFKIVEPSSERYAIEMSHNLDLLLYWAKVNRLTLKSDGSIDYAGGLYQAGVRGIPTNDIRDLAVTTSKIADLGVTTAKLADLAVTSAKLTDAAVITAKLADASVTTTKIADLAVTTAKIADEAVTGAKIAAHAITDKNISPMAAIALTKLARYPFIDEDVSDDIAANWDKLINKPPTFPPSVHGNEAHEPDFLDVGHKDLKTGVHGVGTWYVAKTPRADQFIDHDDLVDIRADQHHVYPIPTAGIADRAVTGAKIADLAVTMDKIADGAVTTAKIADLNVTTAKIADLAVTTGKLASLAVTEPKIATGAVTEPKIATGAVTEAKIAAGAVTAPKIATGAVTLPKIRRYTFSYTLRHDASIRYSHATYLCVFFGKDSDATGDVYSQADSGRM